MIIIIAIITIIVISIVLSLWSLRNLQKDIKLKETQEALKKERVVFHSSDVSSPSDEM